MLCYDWSKATTLFACLLLASCAMFSEDKLVLDGERISVLNTETRLHPDYPEGEYKVVCPDLILTKVGLKAVEIPCTEWSIYKQKVS